MTNKTNTIEVKTLHIPRNMVLRSGGMIFGLIIVSISVLMLPTIILAIPGFTIPGFFGLLIGFLVMYAGMPKKAVECYACSSEFKAKIKARDPKCGSCQTVNPIQWVLESK